MAFVNNSVADLRFYNNVAPVRNSGKWGYIDKEGKFVINTQFDFASNFYSGIAFITSNNKVGIIDKEGKYVVNPQFDAINYGILINKATFSGLVGNSDIDYDQDRLVETDFFDAAGFANMIWGSLTEIIDLKTANALFSKCKYTQDSIRCNTDNFVVCNSFKSQDAKLYIEVKTNLPYKTCNWLGTVINSNIEIELYDATFGFTNEKFNTKFDALKTALENSLPSSLQMKKIVAGATDDPNEIKFESPLFPGGIKIISQSNRYGTYLLIRCNKKSSETGLSDGAD